MHILIETPNLILREFTMDDIKELHSICTQKNILKWMPDWNVTISERKGWIHWVQENYRTTTRTNVRIMLAVTLKTNQQLIGMVGIGNKEEVSNEIEIAYFISEYYSKHGYTTEASSALVRWAFHNIKLDHLIAIVEPENLPSQKVIEKCGFLKEKEIRILNSGDITEKTFYYYRKYNKN